jgi:hypothetical protein
LLCQLKDIFLKMDLEKLNGFVKKKDQFINRHHDNMTDFIKLYNSNIFKVKNSELRNLRDEYYINLAKEKLNVKISLFKL